MWVILSRDFFNKISIVSACFARWQGPGRRHLLGKTLVTYCGGGESLSPQVE